MRRAALRARRHAGRPAYGIHAKASRRHAALDEEDRRITSEMSSIFPNQIGINSLPYICICMHMPACAVLEEYLLLWLQPYILNIMVEVGIHIVMHNIT